MAGFELNQAVVMIVMVAYMQFHTTVAKNTHVVGGPAGWTIPASGSHIYSSWAATKTFNVGDDLVFNFPTGKHTVAEVPLQGYDQCNTTDRARIYKTGPATITLTKSGTRHYICTFHCKMGQKLSVNVK
ncbi:unnamed protein product [Lactuca saligna]|uniref:Phytocyanin domain-containing protein n=1 Tax=Lactuca saligna TaxID=75948 RepID=A0AA35Z4J2_LACSI|nr:unnamed protein product [Lactuca saligna]